MEDIGIICDNRGVIVAVKPVGVSSQKDTEGKYNDMLTLIAEKTGRDKSSVYCVHRLDTAVGGIMVFADSKKSAAALSKQIEEGVLDKYYLAVCKGEPDDSGEMTDLLFKDSRSNKSYVVKKMRKGVREASLTYEKIASREGTSLVKVHLNTGRSHQIRLQFASRKMPLLGDGKYGGNDNRCTVALWSYRIGFYTDAYTEFECIPDTDKYPWSIYKDDIGELERSSS